jgi:hypothetical protein
MGAMENWGLVTYRESALMIDDEKASIQQKQRVAIVVAHELAHQVRTEVTRWHSTRTCICSPLSCVCTFSSCLCSASSLL